jgi:hypothetical protein
MGFNEVDAALRHFALGEPVPELRADSSGIALRYWNELYVAPEATSELRRTGSLSDPRAEVEDWGQRP